jgi:hypothetical protein
MPFAGSFTGNFGWGTGVISDLGFDPYFQYVSLLLHMDGENGSTDFIDSSPRTKIVTPQGGASITTSNFRFGGASGFFNNTDAYLTTPDDVDFDISTGDWTFELFCRIFPVEFDILIDKAVSFGYFPFQLRVANNRFNVRGYTNELPIPSLAYNLGVSAGPIVVPGTWYHVAATRRTNTFYLYVNGALVDSITNNNFDSLYYSVSPLSIGATSNGQGRVAGNIDDLRITKGIARYSGLNFNVRTSPYPDE